MHLLFLKLLKALFIFVVVFIAFILNYLFFAWFLSMVTTTPTPQEGEKRHTVYVSSNGVHTDLIFHKSLLQGDFWGQLKDLEGREYIAMGWGDKGFYLHTPSWADLKFSTAFSAAFLLTESLMHVSHYKSIQPSWKAISLTDNQLESIKGFVAASFDATKDGKMQILEGAGYGKNDFFYKALGSYTCIYTCNVWVNQALKKANVKTAVWAPFANGIMKHL